VVLGIVVRLAQDHDARAGSAIEQRLRRNERGGTRVPYAAGERLIDRVRAASE